MDQADGLDGDDDNGSVPVSATSLEDELTEILRPKEPAPATRDVALLNRFANHTVIDDRHEFPPA
jgi:hypothetical protein